MPPGAKAVDFGSRLRQARERRGVGLREIANETKISMAVLEALERNDVSKLPGGIFGRAFVRSYAAKIGLDPEETVEDFLREFPHESVNVGHSSSPRLDDPESFESDRRMASVVLMLLGISVPLAAAVIYFGSSGRDGRAVDRAASAPTEQAAAPAASAPAAVAPLRVELTAIRDTTLWITADDQPPTATVMAPGGPRTYEIRRELVLSLTDAGAIAWRVDGVAGRPLGADGEAATLRLTPDNYRQYLALP